MGITPGCVPDEDYIVISAEDNIRMEVGESRKEAYSRMQMLAHPKHKVRIGCWNVRTMYSVGKTAQVCREMVKYKIDILGISECRWTEVGKIRTQDNQEIIFSGKQDRHEYGVAIIMSNSAAQSLMSWKPVSDRIITARFYSKYIKTTIIQTYAPTNEADDEVKNTFYEELQKIYDETPKHDMIISIGDWNAKLGSQLVGEKGIVGKHVLQAERNDNGTRFVSSCEVNNMAIVSTMFPHKDIHKYTWTSPNGVTRNQIDHIAINGRFKRSVLDARTFREADVNSDHNLLVGTVKLKLAKVLKKKETRSRFNVNQLKLKDVKHKFTIELRNRFSCLEEEGEIIDVDVDLQKSLDQNWKLIKETYNKTAEKVLGRRKGKQKPWISNESWSKIDERRSLKAKVDEAKSDRIKQKRNIEYSEKAREVKRSLRHDKRKWADDIAREAENAYKKGNMRGVYECTKRLCNSNQRRAEVIKDKDGKLLTTENEVLQRWKQHFSEILNRPEPVSPAVINTDTTIELDISNEYISKVEIRAALKDLKNGKAAGSDDITAEVLKADTDTTIDILEKLFRKIWDDEVIPTEWREGLIVKLPKKGDLTKCGNWRGLTLMSIPAKILGRTIIRRLREAVDLKLRIEQAGFRKGRGTIEQIFILRNIIEQSIEWNTSLYMTFVDYEKAFDSISRDTLWKLMKLYGIPEKFINMVKAFYDGAKVAVINGERTSEWFEVKSGVKQGCVMSGFLFLLVIDWIMSRTVEGGNAGIKWRMMRQLEDLDYADDIVLVSELWTHAQKKLDKMNRYGEQVGLKINTDKTNVMRIHANNNAPLKINNHEVVDVSSFTYLGANVTQAGGADEDIKLRIGKARYAYHKLQKVWSSAQYFRRTKMKIFKSNVIPVLLYGCETWRMTDTDEKRLDTFVHKCLRRILKVYWPEKVSNEDIRRRANIEKISMQIRIRRWKYIGHILRKSPDNHQRIALRWTPEGKRKRGRPKETWRRTVEREMKMLKLSSWEHAAGVANNRDKWRNLVDGLTLHSGRNRSK